MVKITSLGISLFMLILSPLPTYSQPNAAPLIAFASNAKALKAQGNDIFTIQLDGSNVTNLTHNSGDDSNPAWSPDGRQIVFNSDRSGNYDIYLMNAEGTAVQQITSGQGANAAPSWSPDGKEIAFHSNRDGNQEIYVMNADGSNQRNLTNDPSNDATPAWSPDGTRIAFVSDRSFHNYDVFVLDLLTNELLNLTHNSSEDTDPAWSPDGKRLSFISDRHYGPGSPEIYTMNASGSDIVEIIGWGDPFGGVARWSPDGKKLLFNGCTFLACGLFTVDPQPDAQPIRIKRTGLGDSFPVWQPLPPTETPQ